MIEATIRHIQPSDDPILANIIRKTMEEFGVNRLGTVYYEESTDHLSNIFTTPRSVYYVAIADRTLVGGAGIYPTEGLPIDTCELVKMYLSPQARGIGLGKTLMQYCLKAAVDNGFGKIYLETLPELTQAILMYKKFGFENLSAPIGNSKHYGCGNWMTKDLHFNT